LVFPESHQKALKECKYVNIDLGEVMYLLRRKKLTGCEIESL
jgi:hypothetical protein